MRLLFILLYRHHTTPDQVLPQRFIIRRPGPSNRRKIAKRKAPQTPNSECPQPRQDIDIDPFLFPHDEQQFFAAPPNPPAPAPTSTFPPPAAVPVESRAPCVSTSRFLISPARLKKAFSTLMFDFAETSMNGIPSSSASAWPCSVLTTRFSSQSHLLPMRILLTPSLACCSTLENQVRMSGCC